MTSASSLKRKVRAAARSEASNAILDAAERVFASDGIDGAAMQSIASKAGTSVGTLYNYFADKSDLVRALFEDRHRRLGESIDASLTSTAAQPFRARLESLVRAVLVHFDTHRAFLQVALAADSAPSLTKKRSAMRVLRNHLDDVIQAGIKEGAVDQKRAKLGGAALSGILRAVLFDGIEEAMRTDRKFESLVDDVVGLFLHGVAR